MRREEGAIGYRHQRLTDVFGEELRGIFLHEVQDPRLAEVTVSAVELSVDYRNVRVHVAVRSKSTKREVEASLERSTAFIRRRLGEAIDMKRIPDIRFVVDSLV